MNLIDIFDKMTSWLRNAIYFRGIPKGLKVYGALTFKEVSKKFKEVKVRPGWLVFFWNRKINYVDHIAIVIEQETKNLTLSNAKLLHGTPPPVGKAYGPFSFPIDYSGIRIASAMDYVKANPDMYSKIIIGVPRTAARRKISLAGHLAKKIGYSGLLLNNRPAFYSFQVLNAFSFVQSIDYKGHSGVDLTSPYHISKAILGDPFKWGYTYCGDLVGQIYKAAGIRHLPKATVLTFSGYRSSTFYEWLRKSKSLKSAIVWKEKNPLY